VNDTEETTPATLRVRAVRRVRENAFMMSACGRIAQLVFFFAAMPAPFCEQSVSSLAKHG
jgi:hypothetical protein